MVHLLTHTRNPCERFEVERRCEATIKEWQGSLRVYVHDYLEHIASRPVILVCVG